MMSTPAGADGAEMERHGMDWLIAGVLLILIVTVLVRLRRSERQP
jgi:hypothetical protein